MSKMESKPAYRDARLLVVMGSSGCGKSTIGEMLAGRLNATYVEGDDYHTPENKTKMASGTPLNDEDRRPWLQNIAMVMQSQSGICVATCSALKRAYREQITETAKEPVLFVYLHGEESLLASRLAARKGHFMNKNLLSDQLATLEPPSEEEFSLTVSIDNTVAAIVEEIESALKR